MNGDEPLWVGLPFRKDEVLSRNLVTPTNNNAIELSFTESVFILSLAVLQN